MDILHSALKDMKQGEEILCTKRAYRLILERFFEFRQRNPMLKFVVQEEAGLNKIRRMR